MRPVSQVRAGPGCLADVQPVSASNDQPKSLREMFMVHRAADVDQRKQG
jgi:hypothetical protein